MHRSAYCSLAIIYKGNGLVVRPVSALFAAFCCAGQHGGWPCVMPGIKAKRGNNEGTWKVGRKHHDLWERKGATVRKCAMCRQMEEEGRR